MKPRLPFWWVKDPDTLGDFLYDLAREEMGDPSEGPQPW